MHILYSCNDLLEHYNRLSEVTIPSGKRVTNAYLSNGIDNEIDNVTDIDTLNGKLKQLIKEYSCNSVFNCSDIVFVTGKKKKHINLLQYCKTQSNAFGNATLS